MRVLIQRVKNSKVLVDNKGVSEIGQGLLLLLGVAKDDTVEDIERLSKKVAHLRIFGDEKGKMNLNIKEVCGSVLSVPQFTLHADTKKGNRPGFESAAEPKKGNEYWKAFNASLKKEGIEVKEGVFGAHMQVTLTNDGPVTIWLDSKKEE